MIIVQYIQYSLKGIFSYMRGRVRLKQLIRPVIIPVTEMATNIVTDHDVGKLAGQLNEIAGKWELFLSQLKVPEAKREQIKLQRANYPNHAQLCLLDGLEFWVKYDDSPTYHKIVSALKSEVIDNTELALRIQGVCNKLLKYYTLFQVSWSCVVSYSA